MNSMSPTIRYVLPIVFSVLSCPAAEAFRTSEFIFEPEAWHNHSSSIVELPNGDLFACWYHGSGERTADDVKVEAARLRRGTSKWEPRFTLADTPGFPDTNPALFVDRSSRFWLLWPVIIANEWHTALMEYRIASKYEGSGVPRWDVSESLLLKPGTDFAAKVRTLAANWPEPVRSRVIEKAGDKYFSRMGWMTRVHPLQLPSGRILVPLYSDGFDFSLVGISDDDGKTWHASGPMVGHGGVQPSIVRRRDGTLVAYMRDNGPAPKRIQMSTSSDNGETWTQAIDLDLPNPGSGIEAIVLRDGTWALIYNDLEKGRHSLAVSLSDDEGKSWKWTRHLESDPTGYFHYPSLIQAKDGSLHATYSVFLDRAPGKTERKSIRHTHFNVSWVREGDGK